MKIYFGILLTLCTIIFAKELGLDDCEKDVTKEYREAVDAFHTKLYKSVAKRNYDNFAISQHSIWLTLAALSEGADETIQAELFTALHLPNSKCLREKYYEIATTLETSGDDVEIKRHRSLALDTNVKLNTTWADYVKETKVLEEITYLNIRDNIEESAKKVKEIMGSDSNIPTYLLGADSVVLDTLDYTGKWTITPAESEVAPFYNDRGIKLGDVEYLTMKIKARVAFIESINAKVLEVSIGHDERYHMLFLLNNDEKPMRMTIEHYTNTLIVDTLNNQKESETPIPISIPKMKMNTVLDVKFVLEELGLEKIFGDEAATRYVSEPSAMPTSYFQRVTFAMESKGINPHPQVIEGHENNIGLEATVGTDFIANRPFMYGLFDSKTRTCLFSGAYSGPM